MKKIVYLILVVSLSVIPLCSCGNNSELSRLKKENEELKQQLSNNEENPNDKVEDSVVNSHKSNNVELKEVNLGEMVSVQTEFGDFEIQIDNVHKTDIYDDEPDVFAATVQCVVNNISYSSELYPNTINGYDIAEKHNFLQLADNNNVAFPFYSISGPHDGIYSIAHKLSVGSKARESYPFLVPITANDVSVIINNQYVVNTTIN